MHEAIPRLCEARFRRKRWFLQMLEPSLTTLARDPSAAMFTSTVLCHRAAAAAAAAGKCSFILRLD